MAELLRFTQLWLNQTQLVGRVRPVAEERVFLLSVVFFRALRSLSLVSDIFIFFFQMPVGTNTNSSDPRTDTNRYNRYEGRKDASRFASKLGLLGL